MNLPTPWSLSNLTSGWLLFIALFLCLLPRSQPVLVSQNTSTTSKNITISAELISISGRLSHIGISTRDINIKECSLSSNYRYDLLFQIKNNLHIRLLSGDIAINPGPCNFHVNRSVKCLAMNAHSLISTDKLTEFETVCNLNCFQDLIYCEQIGIVWVNETWLNGNIDNSEILHSDYTILRKDHETRGGGVLKHSFKSVRKVHQNQYLEIIFTEITTSSNNRLLICSCYRTHWSKLAKQFWPLSKWCLQLLWEYHPCWWL
jgi:hypothetical protein